MGSYSRARRKKSGIGARRSFHRTKIEQRGHREETVWTVVLLGWALILNGEKILEELEAGAGEHRLGVELHPFDAQFAMAEPHDGSVGGFCGNFERARQRFSLDDQRMIPRGLKILGEAAEHGLAIVMDFAGFPVHDFRRAYHTPAKRRADRLVPQAHAENRNLPRETLHHRDADARLLRRARAGRDYD